MKQISLFKKSVSENGLMFTLSRTKQYMKYLIKYKGELIGENPVITGIIKEKTLCGPETVQIDLTNKCNSSCIGCWLYSPYLGLQELKSENRNMYIPYDKILKTLQQLKKLGTKNIILSGGGEPFMHPKIMDVIHQIKKKGFKLTVITNFNLVSQKRIETLVKENIDELFVSVWAGTAETYVKTHPNQTKKSFEKLKQDLKYLTSIIKKENRPRVLLLNVINNQNFNELDKIVNFGIEVGANGVEFTLLDSIKSKTEVLLLNELQKNLIARQVSNYRQKMDVKNVYHKSKNEKIEIFGLGRFNKRLNNEGVLLGDYDKRLVDSIPCYAGYSYARIMADGKVIPCCKGAKHPLGNINENDFKEIWFSSKYEEFRLMAKNEKKSHVYFKKINCYKGCDNYLENKRINDIIVNLPSVGEAGAKNA